MRTSIALIVFLSVITSSKLTSQHLYDTTYYKKIYDQPALAYYQSAFQYGLGISQKVRIDSLSDINYTAESPTQFGFTYSKNQYLLSVALFQAPPAQSSRKGNTKSMVYNFSKGDQNTLFEMNYRFYKGFYDKNSRYLPEFTDSSSYFQNSTLKVHSFNINHWTFFNYRKFSYNAAYRGSAKQRKSAASWLSFVNAHYNNYGTKRGLVPEELLRSYSFMPGWYRFSNLAFSVGGGGSATLIIFKNFFINGTITVAPGLQWARYRHDNSIDNKIQYAVGASFRNSFGYNSNRFFVYVITIIDQNYTGNRKVGISSQTLRSTFTLGYRFKQKK